MVLPPPQTSPPSSNRRERGSILPLLSEHTGFAVHPHLGVAGYPPPLSISPIQDFMTGEYALLGLETEYFGHQSGRKWGLGQLPDPRDPNPVRYALLACITEELVKAFNWRLGSGMQQKGASCRT